ncbi:MULTISPECIES: hypothetical protein [unclassified Nodularia (in: cyanobacteria)]|uniref:hypothetical protein n=1 Tax=unclassified Nodularia (in: cyanobacteria) TaxID=2656917 RepID=UPI00188110DA|nr:MULTISPECIES: hypothetical protein [unclassified Nodularia (in: cyanobacteria)]MBE9199609.1 hypothetical protein [Nodularia sp. LEGE 06071]MCC2694938.1 hypothetical protein [Nodularia sp. LEGE 04288]
MDNFIGIFLRRLERVGIFVGNEGVYLNELRERPTFVLEGTHLTIETAHSMRNSAKEIYKLELEFKEGKFLIRAFQKLVSQTVPKKYRQEFSISEQSKNSISHDFEFYWVDPDNTLHLLEMSETK